METAKIKGANFFSALHDKNNNKIYGNEFPSKRKWYHKTVPFKCFIQALSGDLAIIWYHPVASAW